MKIYPLHFFGPGQVVDPNGQPVALRSRKQLALLAYLAIEHQVVQSRELLLHLIWPDETTAIAQNNLRVTLSRLRAVGEKIAPTPKPDGDLLCVDRQALQFNPAWANQVDVNHFVHLVERTRQHAHASRGQCAQCQPLLAAAVQLYQGEFLASFRLDDCPEFEEWLLLQRERLHLLVIEAYSDLANYAEAHDALQAAHTFVQRQIELNPLREPAYRQQMRILARMGERSLALAVFDRCRTLLRAELGLDPEPETLTLYTHLLNSKMANGTVGHSPASGEGTAERGQSEAVPPRYSLPKQLTPFIGREEELAQLQARLADPAYRLLSIVGPGGIGKSRLAQQVAAQQLSTFRDGVYYVALAQVQAVESIPAAIAETIGGEFAASQKSPVAQLIEMLSAKQLLLVLDNFEHLMDGVDLLVDLLQQAPGVVLLVTSRERLNLQAEDLFEVQGLPVPMTGTAATATTFAAVRLFVDRAHRLNKSFKVDATQLQHIVRICQLVEGFPLAIELAATWVNDLTCPEIVAELTQGLDLLETTLRDIDPQHRSLRAVFNSSWRLLSASERRTLALLTVFRGGFNLAAARAVADASALLLGGLRNKSLLRAAGSRRYDMHTLVQQFSAEALLTNPADEQRARGGHSQYFLTLLAEQAIALDTRDARMAGDQIQPDWENITLAWQWATAHADLPLLHNALDGLVRFCNLRGLFQEAQTLLESSLSSLNFSVATPPPQVEVQRLLLHCRLLTALAFFTERRCQFERTLELSRRALTIAQQLDSKAEMINNYIIQASAFKLAADFPRGIQAAEWALQLAEEAGLELQAGLCYDVLGIIALRTGQFDRAAALFQRVLAIHEKTGRIEQRGRAAIGYLGGVAREQGRYDVALHYGQSYLASCEAMEDRRNTAIAQHYLARLWMMLGDFAQAIALEEQSIAQSRAVGDQEMSSFALHAQANAYRYLGQLPEALLCATRSVTLAREIDAPLALAFGLGQLAEVQLALATSSGDWDAAVSSFQEAATILRSIDKLIGAYEAEIGLAELTLQRTDLQAALALITPILPHLPTVAADGWDEPIRAYVVCIKILRSAQDPAADRLLEQALALLDRLAQNITDRTLRQNFLAAVPAHCQLRALNLPWTSQTCTERSECNPKGIAP